MAENNQQSIIPPAAVEAASRAILDHAESPFMEIDNTRKLAVAALEAAWPIIAAEIKAEIARRLQLERGEFEQNSPVRLAYNAAIGVVQAYFAQREAGK